MGITSCHLLGRHPRNYQIFHIHPLNVRPNVGCTESDVMTIVIRLE
jgi:hypothetical protein